MELAVVPVRAPAARPAPPRIASMLLRRPTFVVSALVVALWVFAAITWRWLPIDPFGRSGAALEGPSLQHWFGTDQFGRDVLARVVAGSESVLVIVPAATALATVAGTVIGLSAAWYRGVFDETVMRLFDVFGAFPGIIVAVLLTAGLGRSPITSVWAIAIIFTPLVSRTVRAAALGEANKQYVEAARVRGERAPYILAREILPNVSPAIAVEATMRLGFAIFVSAGLSFLGLGPQPPSPDWGLAVTSNRAFLQTAFWPALFPSLAIASLVIAVNLLADNLREVLDV